MSEAAVPVPVAGVAMTAIGVALIRARESERADRLYDDPLARHFVAAARAGFEPERWARMQALADRFYPGRTVGVRLVDERVREAVAAGCRQIVLLGAGLDTRAYRMGLAADVRIFEIDLPELFAFKEPVLAASGVRATCERHALVADLHGDWPKVLSDSGFRQEVPTFWVNEGSLGYLRDEATRRIVRTLTELSAPGSRFGVPRFLVDPDSEPYRELRNMVAGDGPEPASVPEIGGHDPEFDEERWLDELGWDTEFRSWNEMIAHLDRPAQLTDPAVGNIAAIRR